MKYTTLKAVDRAATRRLNGYREAVLSVARALPDGRLELTDEQWADLGKRFRPATAGIGTDLRNVIHAVIDRTRLPARIKRAIKGCRACGARANALDRAHQRVVNAVDKVRQRIKAKLNPQPPT